MKPENNLDDLEEDYFEFLKQDIKRNGQQVPIAVTSDLRIIDGFHRFEICKELGISLKYEIRSASTGRLLDPTLHIISAD